MKNIINFLHTSLQKRHRPLTGFTLVESFVAITILAFALVGPISIASSSLASSRYARDQVTTSYLAQEAAEYVRGIRDSNHFQIQKGLIPRTSWLQGLETCMEVGGCVIDTFNDFIDEVDYCGLSTCPLKYSAGIYGYGFSWPDSIFTRTVEVVSLNDNEVSVIVKVSWQSGNLPARDLKLRELLLNW